MSIEELLKPRYKVIAEDTSGNFRIGDMFIKSNYGDWFESETFEMPEWELEKYPHLFKKLEWWEERKESEMPEYVKVAWDSQSEEYTYVKIGVDAKWSFYFSEITGVNYTNGGGTLIDYIFPATEEEYIQYQQNKNKKQ